MGASGKELTAEFVLELLKDVPVKKSSGGRKAKDVLSEGEEEPKKRAGKKKAAVLEECDMCRARVFGKKHVDMETGKLVVNAECGGTHPHNKFGGRCTKAKKEGDFCVAHAKNLKFGVWDEDAEGPLHKRICDEKRGIIKAPKKDGKLSDVETDTEEKKPAKATRVKKSAEKVESDSDAKSKKSIADMTTEEEETETERVLVVKELEGKKWMVEEASGDVFGVVGGKVESKPIGKMSKRAEYKKWTMRPEMLRAEDSDDE